MKHMVVAVTEGVAGTRVEVTVFRQAEQHGGLPVRTWAYEGYLAVQTAGEGTGELMRNLAEELFNVAALRD